MTPAMARAMQSETMTTKGPWNLRIFSADEAQGIPFCTIYNEFNKDYTLYISLNPMHDMKIILRAPKDAFTIGRSYNVVVSLDDDVEKSFSGVKTVENDLDITLYKGEPIFDKLASASKIAFAIDDASLTFQVPDLPAAIGDLKACIDGRSLVPPEQAASAIYTDNKKAPVDRKTLTDSYKEAQSLVIGHGTPVAPIASAVKLSLNERDLLESLKKKMSLLEMEKETLRAALAEERQKNLASLKGSIDVSSDQISCHNKLSLLEKKVNDLQAVGLEDRLQATQDKLGALESANQSLREENNRLDKQCAAAPLSQTPAPVSDSSNIPDALDQELKLLKLENSALAKQVAQCQN